MVSVRETSLKAETGFKMDLFLEVCPNPALWLRRKHDCGNFLAQFLLGWPNTSQRFHFWEECLEVIFFMMRVSQDTSLFQAAVLETAEGGQRALRGGLKETLFLAGSQKGTNEMAAEECTHQQLPRVTLQPCSQWEAVWPLALPEPRQPAPCYAEPEMMPAPLS